MTNEKNMRYTQLSIFKWNTPSLNPVFLLLDGLKLFYLSIAGKRDELMLFPRALAQSKTFHSVNALGKGLNSTIGK